MPAPQLAGKLHDNLPVARRHKHFKADQPSGSTLAPVFPHSISNAHCPGSFLDKISVSRLRFKGNPATNCVSASCTPQAHLSDIETEIGRASCREQGCQSV